MSDSPEISVVMSVYNGAGTLNRSVNSVLSQADVDIELIVVDDGSTDHSLNILKEYSKRDRRVRLVTQENQGLTKALSAGCAIARGQYIARQDAGDVSLPGRLIRQLNLIKQHRDSSFVSCGTRYVGPNGEHLYDVTQNPEEATSRLLTLNVKNLRGPSSHPSTLFPRALYERVGGYRKNFYFAQDLDLWIRLAEQGQHVVIPETLYEASITVESISGQYRREQVELTALIVEAARLRREGLSEQQVLRRAENVRPVANRPRSRIGRARAFYFIGSCLRSRNHPRAAYYFREALKSYPLHLKSAARLLGAWVSIS
jgi:glycosyltransferase involved in cell wall biosynthesis